MLGNILKNKRLAMHLSQKDVATKTDITCAYLSEIENNKKLPSIEVLIGLLGILNLSADEVLGIKPKKLRRAHDMEDRPDPKDKISPLPPCKICGAVPEFVSRSLNTNMFYITCPGNHGLLEPLPSTMTGMWYYTTQAIMDWFLHHGAREDEKAE